MKIDNLNVDKLADGLARKLTPEEFIFLKQLKEFGMVQKLKAILYRVCSWLWFGAFMVSLYVGR